MLCFLYRYVVALERNRSCTSAKGLVSANYFSNESEYHSQSFNPLLLCIIMIFEILKCFSFRRDTGLKADYTVIRLIQTLLNLALYLVIALQPRLILIRIV